MTERNDKENTNEEMRGKCNTESKERGKGREWKEIEMRIRHEKKRK